MTRTVLLVWVTVVATYTVTVTAAGALTVPQAALGAAIGLTVTGLLVVTLHRAGGDR